MTKEITKERTKETHKRKVGAYCARLSDLENALLQCGQM
jgi:hypothetical protein